ncbi:MAG: ATP-binding protein [Eubacteriales bacterium]|nr:ATP-binding protein [Eubacteriales bacterium]
MTSDKDLFDRIYADFLKAIEKYGLISEGDRIAVCVSGGKDSMLASLLFKRYAKDNRGISVRYICMDPGYNAENRRMIEENATRLGIPLEIFETQIFESVVRIEKSPCYLCARMRRGWLYRKAKEAGCNKIALGHHFDDVTETVLLSVLYSGQYQTMLPSVDSENFEGMRLIRPLYLVREKDIVEWRDTNNFRFLRCACRFTENSAEDEHLSKRAEIKKLIARLEKTDPRIPYNIFNSTHNAVLEEVMFGSEKELQ